MSEVFGEAARKGSIAGSPTQQLMVFLNAVEVFAEVGVFIFGYIFEIDVSVFVIELQFFYRKRVFLLYVKYAVVVQYLFELLRGSD